MTPEDVLEVGLRRLVEIPYFSDFWDEYSEKKGVTSIAQLLDLCDEFQNELIRRKELDDEKRIGIAIVREQLNKLFFKNSFTRLHGIDKSLMLNDDWIADFNKGLKECLTGDSIFEELVPRKYKTIREMAQLIGVNGLKLTELYTKYQSKNHPLVNFRIGSILLNSKNIEDGLPFLESVLNVAFIYPNYYWHNSHAIEGISQSIGLLIELLGKTSFEEIEKNFQGMIIKILKFYFLYSSRYIYMTNSDLKSVDFYAHRAKIQKAFFKYFIGIYPLGVNPDIQFISDMYLAHQTGLNNGLPMFAKPFDQFYWDSMKMYRHGSHIPNDSGGYQEIEDRTWMELVRDGEVRSIKLANQIYDAFSTYEFKITKNEIKKLINHLRENLEHSPEEFIEKMKTEYNND